MDGKGYTRSSGAVVCSQLLQDLVLFELIGKPLLVKDCLMAAFTVLNLREVEQDLARATKI